MKSVLVVACLFFAAAINSSFTNPDKSVKVTIKYAFKGIEEGYDHNTRTRLYIDDQLVATSTEKKESQANTVSATTTKGKHKIRVVNQAEYEGTWEDHTIENDYSIDCTYDAEVNLKKPLTIQLVFNLDSGTERVK